MHLIKNAHRTRLPIEQPRNRVSRGTVDPYLQFPLGEMARYSQSRCLPCLHRAQLPCPHTAQLQKTQKAECLPVAAWPPLRAVDDAAVDMGLQVPLGVLLWLGSNLQTTATEERVHLGVRIPEGQSHTCQERHGVRKKELPDTSSTCRQQMGKETGG